MVVHRDVAVYGVHALADADLGGEVNDEVHVLQRRRDSVEVADVGADELHLAENRVAWSTPGMDLLDQAVEDANPVAPREQRPRDMAADESRAARDQHPFLHPRP